MINSLYGGGYEDFSIIQCMHPQGESLQSSQLATPPNPVETYDAAFMWNRIKDTLPILRHSPRLYARQAIYDAFPRFDVEALCISFRSPPVYSR
ncbi:MAG: hypothetical protein NPIRA04_00460 [Nitrospirales bacterium]|nr:MAG: hypothetical protein NPIRA04_00460 [Nitrospirales bacterium]